MGGGLVRFRIRGSRCLSIKDIGLKFHIDSTSTSMSISIFISPLNEPLTSPLKSQNIADPGFWGPRSLEALAWALYEPVPEVTFKPPSNSQTSSSCMTHFPGAQIHTPKKYKSRTPVVRTVTKRTLFNSSSESP